MGRGVAVKTLLVGDGCSSTNYASGGRGCSSTNSASGGRGVAVQTLLVGAGGGV